MQTTMLLFRSVHPTTRLDLDAHARLRAGWQRLKLSVLARFGIARAR